MRKKSDTAPTGRRGVERALREAGLTADQALDALDTFYSTIRLGLKESGKVRVRDFGVFSLRIHRPRTARLPGKPPRKVPKRVAVHFKPAADIFADKDATHS